LWLYKADAYSEANVANYRDDAPKIYSTLGLCEESKAVQKWAEGEYSGQANLRAQDATKMATHVAAVTVATTSAPYTGQAPDPSEWLTYDNFLTRFKMRWISSNNGIVMIAQHHVMGTPIHFPKNR
jgi:hypothetical protein